MIMQKMWIAGTDWDDIISDNLVKEVNLCFSELDQLEELRIPRCPQQNNDATKISGFLSPFIIRAKMIMQKMWIAWTD